MRFGQTIVLAVLTVAAAATPILRRDNQAWTNYENCCNQRDNYGQMQECKRPDQWEDDWHDKGNGDWSKWGPDGHNDWMQCHKHWKDLYSQWKQDKDKWYNQWQSQYDHEEQCWESEHQMWHQEHENWVNGNCPKPSPPSNWCPDGNGWYHFSGVQVDLKCVGTIVFESYGNAGQPAPNPQWGPDKLGWYHFDEIDITLKCTEKIVWEYYSS